MTAARPQAEPRIAGCRRPWEWTHAEPVTDRERRLAGMSLEATRRAAAGKRSRQRRKGDDP